MSATTVPMPTRLGSTPHLPDALVRQELIVAHNAAACIAATVEAVPVFDPAVEGRWRQIFSLATEIEILLARRLRRAK